MRDFSYYPQVVACNDGKALKVHLAILVNYININIYKIFFFVLNVSKTVTENYVVTFFIEDKRTHNFVPFILGCVYVFMNIQY